MINEKVLPTKIKDSIPHAYRGAQSRVASFYDSYVVIDKMQPPIMYCEESNEWVEVVPHLQLCKCNEYTH